MIRVRTLLAFPVLALALVACSQGPSGAPFDGVANDAHLDTAAVQKASGEKSTYQKPVRMNGRGKMTSMSFEGFFALQQSGKALVYDARPAFFYNLGHIPGAINLPRGSKDAQIAARETEIKSAIAQGKTIVTYCTGITCPDARALADHISGFGYPVSIFSGGWHAWSEAEMPVE